MKAMFFGKKGVSKKNARGIHPHHSEAVDIVCRLDVRPPIYNVRSRDSFTCAPFYILVWVGEIAGYLR